MSTSGGQKMNKNITYDHSTSFKDQAIEDLFNKHHTALLNKRMNWFKRSDLAYKYALAEFIKLYGRV